MEWLYLIAYKYDKAIKIVYVHGILSSMCNRYTDLLISRNENHCFLYYYNLGELKIIIESS